jgi:hypothetical protein
MKWSVITLIIPHPHILFLMQKMAGKKIMKWSINTLNIPHPHIFIRLQKMALKNQLVMRCERYCLSLPQGGEL